MWQFWKKKNDNKIPPKPRNPNKQLSMLWDYVYNHLTSSLERQDRRLYWQDIKINFILILLALILASLGARLFS